MDEGARTRVRPVELLDRLFEEVREEARNNAVFADRLIKALSVSVVYEGEDALKASDPIYLASIKEKTPFMAIYNVPGFKLGALKKLIKDSNLATAEDLKVKRTKKQLIEFMYTRAVDKANERRAW